MYNGILQLIEINLKFYYVIYTILNSTKILFYFPHKNHYFRQEDETYTIYNHMQKLSQTIKTFGEKLLHQ